MTKSKSEIIKLDIIIIILQKMNKNDQNYNNYI